MKSDESVESEDLTAVFYFWSMNLCFFKRVYAEAT